jgi:hypothetical protein
MRPPLFIAIGVHKPQGMDVLPGVAESVDGLVGWAKQSGYDVVQIDDRAEPVVMERIKDQLTPPIPGTYERDPALLLDRPRILVYFCGHGLHAPGDQYWVLTPGPQQSNHRISASTFRDVLATYGPKQVGIFSDACRSPEAVTGTAQSPVDQYDAPPRPVQKDNFLSAQMGKSSFAVPPKDGAAAYCVFSKVLLRALSEPAEMEALSPIYLQLNQQKVSSDSLADYLETQVPDAALDLGKLQAPQCDPGFRAVNDVYAEFPSVNNGFGSAVDMYSSTDQFAPDDADLPPPRSAMPPAPAAASFTPDADRQNERFGRSISEWRRPFVEHLAKNVAQLKYKAFKAHDPGPLLLTGPPNETSVVLPDGKAKGREPFELLGNAPMPDPEMLFYAGGMGFANSKQSSVYLASGGPWHLPITMHQRLWCVAILGNRSQEEGAKGGCELLSWGSWDAPDFVPDRSMTRLSAAEALKGLSNGALSTRDIPALARDMRYEKHGDPMYGIIPAYLYHRIGDVDNIRRMCSYYKAHHQDVPFDIALLAQLPLQKRKDGGFFVDVPAIKRLPEELREPDMPGFVWGQTQALTVGVAGVTPTLRSGWPMLAFSKHDVHRKCAELAEHLTETPVATLYGDEARKRLHEIFKELE